jgi:hypothetical protein
MKKMICTARQIPSRRPENMWLSEQDCSGRLSGNVLLNELIGDLKIFDERMNQILRLEMEI